MNSFPNFFNEDTGKLRCLERKKNNRVKILNKYLIPLRYSRIKGGKMSGEITMPSCSSCNRVISPSEEGVTKFSCPNCGEVLIIRCAKCRYFGNEYQCPKCGFTGP